MKKLSYIFIGVMIVSSIFVGFFEPEVTDAIPIVPISIFLLWVGDKWITGGTLGKSASEWAASTITQALSWVMWAIFQFFSGIMWIAGQAFDLAVSLSVEEFKNLIEKLTFIDETWRLILNIANISFIFILLYLGISTILEISQLQVKKTLASVIIVALIINFSLFFTKAIIDLSNIIAFQFYHSIIVVENDFRVTGQDAEGDDILTQEGSPKAYYGALSDYFIQQTYLDDMFDKADVDLSTSDSSTDYGKITIGYLMATIFTIVATFVFASGAIAFLRRTFMLIFYMISSPLAFLGYALPQLNGFRNQWKDGLISNAFLAPVYIFCLYLSAKIIEKGNVLEAITPPGAEPGKSSDILAGGGVILVIYFTFVTGLFYGTYLISKKMSQHAVAGTGELGKWLQQKGNSYIGKGKTFAGRNTAGYLANKADKAIGNTEMGNSRYGQKFRDITTKKVANSQFGGSGESRVTIDKRVRDEKEKARVAQSAVREKNEFKSTLNSLANMDAQIKLDRSRGVETPETAALVLAHSELKNALPTRVRNLKTRDLEELSESELGEIYGMLSESQRESVQKSEKLSESTRDKLKDSRTTGLLTAVNSAVNNTDPNKVEERIKVIKDELKKLTEKEKLSLPPNIIQTLPFVDALSQKEIDLYNDKSDYMPDVKKFISDNRYRIFESGDRKSIRSKIEGMKSEDIAKLESKFLEKEEVIEVLTPSTLDKLVGKVNTGTINRISKFIMDQGESHPAYEYITTGPGKVYWNGRREGNRPGRTLPPNPEIRANNPPRRR